MLRVVKIIVAMALTMIGIGKNAINMNGARTTQYSIINTLISLINHKIPRCIHLNTIANLFAFIYVI